MPFNGIVEPEQLTILALAVDQHCRHAGIDPSGPAGEVVARVVLALFNDGAATTEELKAALLLRARATQPPTAGDAMSTRHSQFLHIENIRSFEKKLATESDPAKRDLLVRLLAEENAWKLSPPIVWDPGPVDREPHDWSEVEVDLNQCNQRILF